MTLMEWCLILNVICFFINATFALISPTEHKMNFVILMIINLFGSLMGVK